jgi:PadR family transcriptional regulator, regulatory protein PadR
MSTQVAKLDIPQGTLDLMILTILAREPMHGYGISQRMALLSHDNFSSQSRIAVPVAVPAGAGWKAESGVAAHREQSKRQVLTGSQRQVAGSSNSMDGAGTGLRSPSRAFWRAHEVPASPRVCLHWVFNRTRAERALDDELQAYIDMCAAEKMRRSAAHAGAPPRDSRARRH